MGTPAQMAPFNDFFIAKSAFYFNSIGPLFHQAFYIAHGNVHAFVEAHKWHVCDDKFFTCPSSYGCCMQSYCGNFYWQSRVMAINNHSKAISD